MKDILAAQFESQALDRKATTASQAELVETLQEHSIADKFPKLPKLVTKADLTKFWLIIKYWLTKPKYSLG